MTKKRLLFVIIGLIIICAASYGGQYKGDTPGQSGEILRGPCPGKKNIAGKMGLYR
jgi:hypothetical protein